MLFVHLSNGRPDRVVSDPAQVDPTDPDWHPVTETTPPPDTASETVWAFGLTPVQESDDVGPKLTGTETPDLLWPTVKTWRTLVKVARADVTTVSAVMQIIVWLVPACLRGVRLGLKAYRVATQKLTTDPTTD